MTSDLAISVQGIGKQYRIGIPRYSSLREQIAAGFSRRLSGNWGKVPAEKIWALKDISFDVKQGEVVGIIGRNGAGKSTLLKVLSRITEPTLGEAMVYGRIGALLEVGTGFHPELTGRENIFLNGAILGMKRVEISRKFDDIVEFAEVGKFIDTPVKHYSSGMYVRLAFAVAAHLEPEVLVVDEVLAVGDAEFQRKCLGRMNAVSREGRTVLFVSHNMASMVQLCSRGLLLDQGRLVLTGSIEEVVGAYLNSGQYNQGETDFPIDTTKQVQILKLQITDAAGNVASELDSGKPFHMVIEILAHETVRGTLNVGLNTAEGIRVCHSVCADVIKEYSQFTKERRRRFIVTFPGGLLNEGLYSFTVWVVPGNTGVYDAVSSPLFALQTLGPSDSFVGERKKQRSILRVPLEWQISE
jgi:lipopolysaccharide transport system ATP-binding protein